MRSKERKYSFELVRNLTYTLLLKASHVLELFIDFCDSGCTLNSCNSLLSMHKLLTMLFSGEDQAILL